MSRQNLRNIPRISYYEPEEPSLDEYVFCRDCRDYVYEYCSIHGPLLVVPDSKGCALAWHRGYSETWLSATSRDLQCCFTYRGIPLTQCLRYPGAGIGVFSTLTLPAGVRFGPYRGKITKEIDSVYCWQIYDKDNKPIHVVDAADAERSNWMRYVNCSRHWCEQNLLAYQYKGQVYYRTIRIIPRFTELLVFYGSEFANILNVDLRFYNTPQQVYYENLCKVQSEKQLKNKPPTSNSNQLQEKDKDSNNNEETKEIHIKSKRKLEKTKKPFVTKKRKFQQPVNKNVNAEDVAMNSERKPKKTKTNVLKKEKKQKPINNKETQKENMNGAKINTIIEEFKCNECGKQFSTKDILTDHILKCIKTTEILVSDNKPTEADTLKYFQSEMYSCDICTFKTYNKRSIETHLKMHIVTKVFSCNICEYKCTKKGHLKDHIRTHTGEKPFSCNICEYRCTQKGSLKLHIRTHTGEKPFSCNICEYRCAHKDRLKLHIRTHTGEKPFSCHICEYRCAQKGDLVRHIRTHTGEKPFSCNICEYKCTKKGYLKDHIRTHTGEKPFSCNICDYRCTHKSNMKSHLKTHNSYKCTMNI